MMTNTADSSDSSASFEGALGNILLAILLIPCLIYCEIRDKIQHWQRDRHYALQERVMEQRPIAVLLEGWLDDVDEVVQKQQLRPILEERQQDEQINVMKLRDYGGKWIVFLHNPSPNWMPGPCFTTDACHPNWTYVVVFKFDDGPNTSEKAKDWEVKPSLLAERGPPELNWLAAHQITCWYEYQGTLYVYRRISRRDYIESVVGFWQATPKDRAWLDTLRKAKALDRDR